MTKYTVLHYYTRSKFGMTSLETDQVSKFFDTIQEAEAARVVILNDMTNSEVTPQELRVVQYDFS